VPHALPASNPTDHLSDSSPIIKTIVIICLTILSAYLPSSNAYTTPIRGASISALLPSTVSVPSWCQFYLKFGVKQLQVSLEMRHGWFCSIFEYWSWWILICILWLFFVTCETWYLLNDLTSSQFAPLDIVSNAQNDFLKVKVPYNSAYWERYTFFLNISRTAAF
jgi:hypothetical protein